MGLRVKYLAKACLHFVIVACVIIKTDCALSDNVRGGWLSPADDNWPLVAVHAALTPDGRVLTFGSTPAVTRPVSSSTTFGIPTKACRAVMSRFRT